MAKKKEKKTAVVEAEVVTQPKEATAAATTLVPLPSGIRFEMSTQAMSALLHLLRCNCSRIMALPLNEKISKMGLRKAGYQKDEMIHDLDHAVAEICSMRYERF
jgi:hypothetical protein